MNESFNPQVAAEKARETYRKTALQFEDLALNTPVSEGLRALAEKNIAQAREAYEHSKDALEAGLETLERSLDALGQGATALSPTQHQFRLRSCEGPGGCKEPR